MKQIDSRLTIFILGIAICLSLYGCGGDDTPVTSAPPNAPSGPPQAPRAAGPRAPANRRALRPRRGAKPKPKTKASEEIPPNSFSFGVESPNFVMSRKALPPEREQFAVVTPLEGQTSSQFLTIPPLSDAPAAVPSGRFSLPEGFAALPERGYCEEGLPLRIRCEKDDAIMALVPAGVFTRGTDVGAMNATPRHPVFVSGFYMDIYETTLSQYETFHKARGKSRASDPINLSAPPSSPALGVSWRDALFYAKWSQKKIPTEAQWERAARGPSSFSYVWGEGRPLWTDLRRPGQIDAVGSFPNDKSVFGIYDLSGNAREWCADFYSDDLYRKEKTPDGSPLRDPTGPDRSSKATLRVVKGAGSQGWQTWHRGGELMASRTADVGMRFVLRLELPTEEDAKDSVEAGEDSEQ